MSAAELIDLRNATKQYLDNADERLVRMVYAMLEVGLSPDASEKEYTIISAEQENMLNERIEKYETGQMKFSSWEEVEKRVLSKK